MYWCTEILVHDNKFQCVSNVLKHNVTNNAHVKLWTLAGDNCSDLLEQHWLFQSDCTCHVKQTLHWLRHFQTPQEFLHAVKIESSKIWNDKVSRNLLKPEYLKWRKFSKFIHYCLRWSKMKYRIKKWNSYGLKHFWCCLKIHQNASNRIDTVWNGLKILKKYVKIRWLDLSYLDIAYCLVWLDQRKKTWDLFWTWNWLETFTCVTWLMSQLKRAQGQLRIDSNSTI